MPKPKNIPTPSSNPALSNPLWHVKYRPGHEAKTQYIYSPLPTRALKDEITDARIRAQPRDGLWLFVHPRLSVSPKAVVRSWVKRRVTVALKEAFRARGYDLQGRRVDGAAQKPNIMGSIAMSLEKPLVTAQWGEVKDAAGLLADWLDRKAEERHKRGLGKEGADKGEGHIRI